MHSRALYTMSRNGLRGREGDKMSAHWHYVLIYRCVKECVNLYLLLSVCVRVAAAVFSSSVMFCSVSSDALHFSITTISISVCRQTHTHTLCSLRCTPHKPQFLIVYHTISIDYKNFNLTFFTFQPNFSVFYWNFVIHQHKALYSYQLVGKTHLYPIVCK